jgi:hypothetical protein
MGERQPWETKCFPNEMLPDWIPHQPALKKGRDQQRRIPWRQGRYRRAEVRTRVSTFWRRCCGWMEMGAGEGKHDDEGRERGEAILWVGFEILGEEEKRDGYIASRTNLSYAYAWWDWGWGLGWPISFLPLLFWQCLLFSRPGALSGFTCPNCN